MATKEQFNENYELKGCSSKDSSTWSIAPLDEVFTSQMWNKKKGEQ